MQFQIRFSQTLKKLKKLLQIKKKYLCWIFVITLGSHTNAVLTRAYIMFPTNGRGDFFSVVIFFPFRQENALVQKKSIENLQTEKESEVEKKDYFFHLIITLHVCLPEVLVPITHVVFTRTSIIWLKRRWHKSLAEPLLNPSSFWFVNFDLR